MVEIAVHRDGGDPEVLASPYDAYGDLATVGDEDLGERGSRGRIGFGHGAYRAGMTGGSASANLGGTRFKRILRLGEVTSTNDVAAEAARSGEPEGTVVVADHQRAGRGRRGRTWEAPPGSSLLLSVLLRPPWPPEQAHVATLAVAVAARAAALQVAGVDLGLKWPNDLVSTGPPEGMKVGGILGERIGGAVVVGLGLNVRPHAAATPDRAALDQLGRPERTPIDREELLVAFLHHLDALLSRDPAGIVAEASRHSATLGQRVRVDLGRSVVEGTAAAITAAGHLVLDTSDGSLTVASGEVVHLRTGAS